MTPEHFNPGDACVAWLHMDSDTMRAALEVLLERGGLKRSRVGGTIEYCTAANMPEHVRVLRRFLAKLPAEQKASAGR